MRWKSNAHRRWVAAGIALLVTLGFPWSTGYAEDSEAGASKSPAPAVEIAGQRPNIIVVLADDLGLGDLSATNPEGKIRTPHLQQMADQGLTFLDAHSPSAVCTPTRYALLTGRYSWRSRLARGVLDGTSEHLIPADRPTLGHLLRRAGYRTAMIGKWHLGWDWHQSNGAIDFSQPVQNGPDINGFDSYYGLCGSLDMPPYVWVDTGQITAIPDRRAGVTRAQDPYGWYREGPISPDFKIGDCLPHLFDKSLDYIRAQSAAAREGQPFFLYLALPAPHTPIVPNPPFQGSSGLNPYADFVIQIDHHMGQLLASLVECGLDENTLVIFTSDNGCSPEANFEILRKSGHDPSAGYRGHKADIYEGGHRVPLIVRWPSGIQGGRSTRALVGLTDLYATLESIAGEKPQTVGGEDSVSLVPILDGSREQVRQNLIHQSIDGSLAIRDGSWKLCLSAGSGGWSAPREAEARRRGLPPLQLFHLESDPAESRNLVDQQPDRVAAMLRLIDGQVRRGRSTPGPDLPNDREIAYLPEGVTVPTDD